MAKTSVWSWLLGVVRFSVEGGATERFLNECMAAGLSVSRIKANTLGFTAWIPARQYHCVHKFAYKCRCHVHVDRKIGLRFRFHRYRNRLGIACGIIFFMLICWWMQGYIWTVNYYNLPAQTAARLEEKLFDVGIAPGVRPDSDSLNLIRQKLLLENPEFSSLSFHFIKGRLMVEAIMRDAKPDIVDNHTPMDIVASREGVLEVVEVYSGYAVRSVGQSVMPGDVIVSHTYTDQLSGATVTGYARARIVARTLTTYRCEQPYIFEAKYPTGEEESYLTLHLGEKTVPLYREQELPANYQTSRRVAAAAPMGWSFPAALEWQDVTGVTTKQIQLTPEQAEARAKYLCQAQIAATLANGDIIKADEKVEHSDTGVVYSITVEAREEIGKTVVPDPSVPVPTPTPTPETW